MRLARFPDFGRELRRPFAVHENCYDCAGFYDGCTAWPAARDFACRKYNPLPDVMPGTCGQRLPDTSHKLASAPIGGRPRRPARNQSRALDSDDTTAPTPAKANTKAVPDSRPHTERRASM